MKKLISIVCSFLSLVVQAQVFDLVVNKNMPDAYGTISSAIGRIPAGSTDRYLVFIANGIYNEQIVLPSYNTNVSFIGESAEGVIITNGFYNGDGVHGTSDSYTFGATANDFYAENLTIVNSAGNVGQAVAIKTDGDRQVFKNCRFIGFQDTYYAHSKMQYNLNCTVEGATDFIFGDATCVFDNCSINCVKGGQYITAPADSKFTTIRSDGSTQIHGLLFLGCNITANTGVSDNSYYLGRPWQPKASTVYIQCKLGNHIKNTGWATWDGDNHLSSFFAEYKSTNQEGNLVDISQRADWSYQLADTIVEAYYNLGYFLKKDTTDWDPIPLTIAPDAPTGLTGEGYSFSWNTVPGAKGYVISRNDTVIGFSESDTYSDETVNGAITNSYSVKSVGTNGNLSPGSDVLNVAPTNVKNISDKNIMLRMHGRTLTLSDPAELKLYTLSGRLVLNVHVEQNIELSGLIRGIYIASAFDSHNNIYTKKIILR